MPFFPIFTISTRIPCISGSLINYNSWLPASTTKGRTPPPRMNHAHTSDASLAGADPSDKPSLNHTPVRPSQNMSHLVASRPAVSPDQIAAASSLGLIRRFLSSCLCFSHDAHPSMSSFVSRPPYPMSGPMSLAGAILHHAHAHLLPDASVSERRLGKIVRSIHPDVFQLSEAVEVDRPMLVAVKG